MGMQNNSTSADAVKRKPNTAKGKSYALAYGMIKAAMEKDCPLQAITIEESIITDRLSSTLNAHRKSKTPFQTLNGALTAWRNLKAPEAAIFDEYMVGLRPRLWEWWKKRNAMLHGIAKSTCGEGPDVEADVFMETARQVAVEGKNLADSIKKWTATQVRKAKRNNG